MRMVPLGEVVREAQSGFACGLEDPSGVFQFRMHNVSKESSLSLDKRRRVPSTAHKNLNRFYLEPGDVLFNATNSPDGVGKSVLIPALDERAVFSNHFIRLRVHEDQLYSAYLWRWLQWLFGHGVFLGMCRQWVNQATVSRDDLLGLELQLPSLAEQRRIAAILDKADAIRAKRRQVLAHLNALTQSIFHQMFSQTPASVTVADVALDTRTGPFGSQLLHSEFVGEGISVLGLDNVVDNEFRHGGGRFITSSKYEKLKRYTVIPGDVLISIMGTIGRCVVVPSGIPTAINTKHICAVTPNPELVLSQFLRASFLWHPTARAHLRRQTKGSIMDGLNMGIIRSMPIPLPSLEEQAIFAARFDSVRDAASGVLQAIGLSEQLFASLQSRAFKGEL